VNVESWGRRVFSLICDVNVDGYGICGGSSAVVVVDRRVEEWAPK